MELTLQDFIKETLVQIANAINDANKALAGTGAVAVPANMYDKALDGNVVRRIEKGSVCSTQCVHTIRFDVAVHASESSQKAGGLGIVVAAVAIGGRSKADVAASSESRIQFEIPMLYPEAK